MTPGTPVAIPGDGQPGEGVHTAAGKAVAVVAGTLVRSGGVLSVDPSRPPLNIPEMGDVLIGEVNRLNEKTAELRVLHIEGRPGGHRDVPAQRLFADIFVSELVDRFIPSAGDAMRKRDIVRAKVIKTEPMLKASTKGDPDLGVLYAACPTCGVELASSDATPDFNVDRKSVV